MDTVNFKLRLKLIHRTVYSSKQGVVLRKGTPPLVIDFHQKVISPVDGPRSHFRPSSSQYMRQAMHNYGFFKGYIMGCDRLLRENSEEIEIQSFDDSTKVGSATPK